MNTDKKGIGMEIVMERDMFMAAGQECFASTGHSSYNDPMSANEPLIGESATKKTKIAPNTGEEDIRERDKFYTKPDVARACMDFVLETLRQEGVTEIGTWLEPSAGAGAFLFLMPETNRRGFDIAPVTGVEGVAEQDFLKWHDLKTLARPVVTVGNPPFGRNASLALRFVNQLGGGSKGDYICFILPRTFEKVAMQHKVVQNLDLIATMEMDPNSFTHDDQEYPVPCCFQIWKHMGNGHKRDKEPRPIKHNDFTIVPGEKGFAHLKPSDWPTFAFQRVGGQAGTVSEEGLQKSWKSHYFIKANIDETVLIARLRDMEDRWQAIRTRTAGNPSIGKNELVEEYAAYLERKGLEASPGPGDTLF